MMETVKFREAEEFELSFPVGGRTEGIRKVAAQGVLSGDQSPTLRAAPKGFPVTILSPASHINWTAFSENSVCVSDTHT